MKFFKRHIDKVRDQTDLPDEFSWDNMQSGIYEKMSDKALLNRSSSNKVFIGFFFGAALLMTTSIFYLVFTDQGQHKNLISQAIIHKEAESQSKIKTDWARQIDQQTNNENSIINGSLKPEQSNSYQSATIKQHRKEEVLKSSSDNKSKVNQEDSNIQLGETRIKTSIKSTTSQHKYKGIDPSNQLKQKGSPIKPLAKSAAAETHKRKSPLHGVTAGTSNMVAGSISNQLSDNNNQTRIVNVNAPSVSAPVTFNTDLDLIGRSTIDNRVNDDKLGYSSVRSVIDVAQLGLTILAPLAHEHEQISIPKFDIIKVIESPIKDRFLLSFGLGANVLDLNVSDLPEGSEQASNEKTRVGRFGSVGLSYKFNKSFFVSTGVQYSQLTSRFNKISIRNYTELHTDQLVEEQTNPITGSIVNIYKDVELNVTETRRVQHYNSFDMLSLPIILGYRFDRDYFSPYIGIGGIYNLSLKTKGKTEIGGKILDYSDGLESPYKSRSGFSPVLQAGLDYRIGQHLTFGLQMFYQHSLSKWNTAGTYAARPRLLNLGVKIGKAF